MAINGNLKAAAKDLVSDFMSLRERAMSGDATLGNTMYQISFNLPGQSYQLQQCTNQGSPCLGWNQIQAKNFTAFEKDINFVQGLTTAANYVFQTRGTITNGTIVLNNGRGSTATITVLTAGRVYVQYNLQ
jgi:hypothetical protein